MEKLPIPVLFIAVALTWGTTWLAMQIAVETIPPIFATGMRFLFASPFLICIALVNKSPLLFPPGQRFFQLIISAFYFAIPFSLMIYGETYVSSALAAIIFANMPVAILIASIVFLKENTSLIQVTGLALATASLAGILLEESRSGTENHWQGVTALVSAVVIHSFIYIKCKKKSCNVSVITFNVLPCLFAGLILSAIGWLFEGPLINNFSIHSVLSVFYLGAFAGVFGILFYFSLQKKAKAFHASLVFLVFPLIAIGLEDYVYGHTISIKSLLLIIPLVAGIFITILSRRNSSGDRGDALRPAPKRAIINKQAGTVAKDQQ
jgi:putative membrane protein PagO